MSSRIMSETAGPSNSGYVWAPYIIATAPATIFGSTKDQRLWRIKNLWGFDPQPFEGMSRLVLKSRYSVAQVNSSYYGTIDIKKTDV